MRGLLLSVVVSCFLFVSFAERIQRLTTSEPVFQDIRGVEVDSSNNAYVITNDTPALLHQVNLNNLRLTKTTSLPCSSARKVVLDNTRRRLFIGCDSNTIVKFSIEQWTVEATFTTFHSARNLAFDSERNILYAATYPSLKGITSVIHKINATNFASVDTIEMPTGYRARTLVYDTSRYYLYVGNDASPASITRLWGEPNLQRMDVLTFPKGWDGISASVIDGNNQFAYFGIASPVGRIAKVDLTTFQWVDTISTAGAQFSAAVIDDLRGYAYWTSAEIPSTIYRVRLCDFTLLDVEALQSNDQIPSTLAVRPLSGVITVGTSCLSSVATCTALPSTLIKFQVTQPAVCQTTQTSSRSDNVYQTTVNMRFAGMIPSPSCCPPPEFFSQTPRLQQTCH